MRWQGQCPQCQEWNTLEEFRELKESSSRFASKLAPASKPLSLEACKEEPAERVSSGLPNLDRLLGGGVHPGALLLLSGEPGIGKSTLLLQLAGEAAKRGERVLYCCAEESVAQTASRARRLQIATPELYLVNETDCDTLLHHVETLSPSLLIIDSIQVLYKAELPSSPGSIPQVREVTSTLMRIAKARQLTTLLVGHVTKGGEVAGPRLLEHLVDAFLTFEGERQQHLRLLRALKNRFGPTDEIALFSMGPEGLKPIAQPSRLLLEGREVKAPGSVVVPHLEGSRPLLVEVQALVSKSFYPQPIRRSAGIPSNRLNLLIAVLEKRLGLPLSGCDVFVSVVGGLTLSDPACDLGIALALVSSGRNLLFPSDSCAIGEVGLAGEMRRVSNIERRIREAATMGFRRLLLPASNLPKEQKESPVQLIPIHSLEEAFDAFQR